MRYSKCSLEAEVVVAIHSTKVNNVDKAEEAELEPHLTPLGFDDKAIKGIIIQN